MAILNVDQFRTVRVLKGSMNPGFAGSDGAVFPKDHTLMLSGDAKATLNPRIDGIESWRPLPPRTGAIGPGVSQSVGKTFPI